jgi:hypothetical protein
MNHFTRLIELTSADEEYISAFATSIAPCILRPRQETSLTMEEKHAYKLVRDLLANKDPIFSELKRQSSLSHSSSVGKGPAPGGIGNRPRAISTDESNRKALMEERNKALLEKASSSRGRAVSPGPSPRGGHRRDRSTGGPEGRFPIQVASPTQAGNDRQRSSLGGAVKRASLEVPGADGMSSPDLNGSGTAPGEDSPAQTDKSHARGRSTTKFVGGQRISVVPSAENTTPTRGVTLEDKPMED